MRQQSTRLRFFIVGIVTLGLLGTAAIAVAKDRVSPKEGTAHAALLEGLKLIKDGKFDDWKRQFCHTNDLCHNDNAWRSVLRYNLPAMQRLAPHCIKDGDTLLVTRTDGDPDKDDRVTLFIECNPQGMPRPFHLKKEGRAWKFSKI